MTGLDFSKPAVEAAQTIAAELDLDARFVCADVFDTPAALGQTFDIVYTGIGAPRPARRAVSAVFSSK